MTGGAADCSDQEGDSFTAWDGYITGRNLKLVKDAKIIQSWRTSQFNDSDEDSQLEIRLKKTDGGTELLLIHTDIPEGQPDYQQGWIDNYFVPMHHYFG
jgi:activator of HSP90 ATPase